MFVRTKTTPNSPRRSIQVVENSRDAKGKVKQKIIRYIGIALDEKEEEQLKKIAHEFIANCKANAEANSPQLRLFPAETTEEIKQGLLKKAGRKTKKRIEDILPVSQVSLDMITEESRIIDGVHEVAGHLYDELKYNKILTNKKYNNILKDLVLCRISEPSSKLATSKLLKRYYMKEHQLDSIYRTMDNVFAKIDNIKLRTFESTLNLIPGGVEIILFDVTTLHFESTEVDELRKFGYSKNFRFNTTQVVLALATNSDGLPVGYELFEGNKAEVKTLIDSIDKWQTKFQINDVCFIGDRAMFSADNLKQLEARGYKYIVAAKLRTLPHVMQSKIFNEERYNVATVEDQLAWVGSFAYEESDLQILQEQQAKPKEVKKYLELISENQGRRFVVSYSSKRAHHDRKHRETLIKKIDKQLDKTTNSCKLLSNAALKKFTSSIGKSDIYIDQDKIESDAQWDGIHGVVTNIAGNNLADILSQYRRLVKIEECFRVNKTDLKMRPIYHFKSERIHAHIAICYMAFALIRQLQYRVKLIKKISVAEIIDELNSVQASIYIHKVTKDRYRVPGCFSNSARKIYEAIGLKRNLDAHPII